MPSSYFIDLPNRLVVSRAWGVVTELEILAHARHLPTNPRFEPSYRQLADFRGATDFRVSAEDVRHLGQANPWGRGARRAILVGTDLA